MDRATSIQGICGFACKTCEWPEYRARFIATEKSKQHKLSTRMTSLIVFLSHLTNCLFLCILKVIGNRSLPFLEQRQKELEKYLQKVLFFLQQRMCREFIEFLEFNKYDIVYLLQDLANIFFQQSELLLQFFNKRYEFSVLELHAISERLKLECPTNETIENIYDFTHVVDFCTQIERLTVRPRNVRLIRFISIFVLDAMKLT